jgi:hypothetical protein
MNIRVILFFLLSSFFLQPSGFGQGSLTPPGPPEPTMKSLEQVASTGIAINAAHTPGDDNSHFIITQPGNYFLTGNVDVTKITGIRVAAAGVSVDLNGFEIRRTNNAGGQGIEIIAGSHRCMVRHGSISGLFDFGVHCASTLGATRGGSFLDLTVTGATSMGLLGGEGHVIERCMAHDNSGDGIVSSTGSTISHCSARNNGHHGIVGATTVTVSHCTVTGNGATYSGSAGIFVIGKSLIVNCTSTNNVNNGTVARGNGAGIHADSGTIIKDCVVDGNAGNGIQAGSECQVVGNTLSGNGTAGASAGIEVNGSGNRVESNNTTNTNGTATGILVTSGGNIIIKNSSRGGTKAYDIAAGNSMGQETNVYNATTTTTINTSNAWANFLY